MKKLSIIVPVYNVEPYIRPCVESIFMQGLAEEDFEVILVNDGTTDNSFGQIRDITDCHDNITVVEQSNQGLSAARNAGLARATGQYIMFLDSDDLLVSNSVAPLLNNAVNQQPDLLMGNYVKLNDTEIANLNSLFAKASCICKRGERMFVEDFNPRECYVWKMLYRREFLNSNHIRFIPGLYFEDIPFTVECCLKADKCMRTDTTLYIYRQREGTIVTTIDHRKIYDFNQILAILWQYTNDMTLSAAKRRKMMDTTYAIFCVETWHIAHNKTLLAERKNIMNDLKKCVPGLRFTGGLKQRLTSFLYTTMPLTYIWLKSH